MAISMSSPNLSNAQILTLMGEAIRTGQEAQKLAAGGGGVQSQPVQQVAATGTEAAEGKKGKGKKGKPDHAGGPKKGAKALPPGLQGKDLPDGNPWKAVADRLKQEAEAANKPQEAPAQAPGVMVTALEGMIQMMEQASKGQNTALELTA